MYVTRDLDLNLHLNLDLDLDLSLDLNLSLHFYLDLDLDLDLNLDLHHDLNLHLNKDLALTFILTLTLPLPLTLTPTPTHTPLYSQQAHLSRVLLILGNEKRCLEIDFRGWTVEGGVKSRKNRKFPPSKQASTMHRRYSDVSAGGAWGGSGGGKMGGVDDGHTQVEMASISVEDEFV